MLISPVATRYCVLSIYLFLLSIIQYNCVINLFYTCVLTGNQQETTPTEMTSSRSTLSATAVVGVASDTDHAQLTTSAPVFTRKPQSASTVEGDKFKVMRPVQGHPRPRVRSEKDGSKPVDLTSKPRLKVSLFLRCFYVLCYIFIMVACFVVAKIKTIVFSEYHCSTFDQQSAVIFV